MYGVMYKGSFEKTIQTLSSTLRVVLVGKAGEDDGGFKCLEILAPTTDGNIYKSVQGANPLHNTYSVLQNSYAHTGWLIAMSINQEGLGPMCFAPWVYDYICC